MSQQLSLKYYSLFNKTNSIMKKTRKRYYMTAAKTKAYTVHFIFRYHEEKNVTHTVWKDVQTID